MIDAPSTDLTALQVALDALDQPAAVRNGAGRYLVVNPAWAELLGLPAERICGKPDAALQPADLANHAAEIDGLVIGSGMPMDSDEHLLCRFGRRRLRAARHPLLDGETPWAVAVVLAEPDQAEVAAAARDRLAAALAAEPVHAAAPPVPEAARREREEETQRRLEEAEARALAADERADAAEARVQELLEELRAAKLDLEALLRRSADPEPVPVSAADTAVAPVISWGEADEHRLAAALRGATNVRSAARALLTTLGPVAGYTAGAVWQAAEDGALRCVGAWSNPGEDTGGWETSTWHAALRDAGLVPDARGAAPAVHATDGSCPRAEIARHVGLSSAVTFGAGEDVVVELLRPVAAEAEPLEGLAAARMALADALARIAEGEAESGDRQPWAAARL